MSKPPDRKELAEELKQLVSDGMSLSDAIRTLHKRPIGLIWLWPAVMDFTGMTREESMRMVIHDNAPWNEQE